MNRIKTIKTETKILLIITGILLIISLNLNTKPKNNVLSFSLLNENDIDYISKIEITFTEDDNQLVYELVKIGEIFFLRKNNLNVVYEVKQNTIENFFSKLVVKNNLQLVSEKMKDIFFKNHISIKLFHENKTILSEILFGDIDVLGLNRYLKLSSERVYISPDRYADFLKPKANIWIDMQPFKEYLRNQTIQAYTLNDNAMVIKNNETSKKFENIETQLSSFYMLDIFPESSTLLQQSTQVLNKMSIILMTGTNETIHLDIYKLDTTDYIIFSSLHNAYYLASEYAIKKVLDAFE
ncbi:MAG: hypothetical protein IJU92_01280 [Spirochaetaceae bacterium]|nr:hypothetical protein [Spirochaetaceae bacterium]